MVALLVFIMATLALLAANKMLDGRGPFGGNVLKNPARCTSATAFRIVHVRAKMVARVHITTKNFSNYKIIKPEKHRKRFGGKTFVIKSLSLGEKNSKSSNSRGIFHCFANILRRSEKYLTMVARIEHYMTKALIATYEMKMTAIKNTEKLRR